MLPIDAIQRKHDSIPMLPIDAFMLTCTGKEQGCTLTLAENRSVKP